MASVVLADQFGDWGFLGLSSLGSLVSGAGARYDTIT
jgi:hypothetical protein